MYNLICESLCKGLNRWMLLGVGTGLLFGTATGFSGIRHRRIPAAWSAIPAALVLILWGMLNLNTFIRKDPPVSEKPHIILIMLDTLRADVLSLHGARGRSHPALEAFAKDAVVFKNIHCQHPSTPPSIQSMLTSLYPETIAGKRGLESYDYSIREEFLLLSEVLANAGYRTLGIVDGGFTCGKFGMDQGYGVYIDIKEEKQDIAAKMDRLFDFFREKEEYKVHPFFLFFHTYQIHLPYIESEPYKSMYYKEVEATAEDRAEWEVFKTWISCFNKSEILSGSYDNARQAKANYEGGVYYTDEKLGRFFERLKGEELYDKSLIIITSDHGEMFMEKPYMMNHGGFLFQELVHVPLIIKFPHNRYQGRVVESLGGLIDVAPTLMDYIGLDYADFFYQGQSLIPAIADRKKPRPYLFSQVLENDLEGVILEDVKYITPMGEGQFLDDIIVLFAGKVPDDISMYYVHGGIYERGAGSGESYMSRAVPDN